MEKISSILNKNRSDKCYTHTYQIIYDSLFAGYDRDESLDILESGVEYGGSLAAWKEYFPNARVTGVDVKDVRKEQFKNNGTEFILKDIKEYIPDRKFDIIIEDGNHSNFDAVWSAVNLCKHLKDTGSLIIEDVQEGFAVPFLLWGQLSGAYIVQAIDMRRLTNTHDNFIVVISKLDVK